LIVDADRRLARQETILAEHDCKIKALTFEQAYYKRVRFGKASKARGRRTAPAI
jgi:hypothetical protein